MELLTINLAANQTQQFAKAGRYFEIIDSAYAVRVDFNGDQGQQTDSMVNALSGLFIEDPFAGFAITNGATPQSVTVLILESGRGGSRRQPGVVRVIDQSADKSMAGNQFFGSYSAPAAAGLGSVVMLGAGGGGGKKAVIKILSISSSITGSVILMSGTGPGSLGLPTAALNPKVVGGANSGSARASGANCAGASPSVSEIAGVASYALRVFLVANTPTVIPITTPIIVGGAFLLVVSAEALNRDISVAYDIEES